MTCIESVLHTLQDAETEENGTFYNCSLGQWFFYLKYNYSNEIIPNYFISGNWYGLSKPIFIYFLLFRPFFSSLIVISPVLWFYHGDWNLSLGDVYIFNSWPRQSTEGWWVYMVVWSNGDIIFAVILQNIFSKIKKKNTDLFHCLCEFFRFKVQKRKTDRKTLHSHLLQYYFPVNVTLKLHYFRKTSFLIRDDSETSCQLSSNITKLFYFCTRHSIMCSIHVCL